MDASDLGAELRALRRRAGLTQQQLADRCGLRQSNIAAYEAGRRAISQAQAERIRAVMRRRPSEVLADKRAAVRALVRAHRGASAAVFGSVARGRDRFDSDIDLLVDFDAGASLFDLSRLRRELEDLLDVRVDIVSTGGLRAGDDAIVREAVPL